MTSLVVSLKTMLYTPLYENELFQGKNNSMKTTASMHDIIMKGQTEGW